MKRLTYALFWRYGILVVGLAIGMLSISGYNDEALAQVPEPCREIFVFSDLETDSLVQGAGFVSTGFFTEIFTGEFFGTFEENLTLNPDGTFFATTVITTPDGSTLLTEDSGPIFSPEPLDYQLDGGFVVTGGTGEFSGAFGGGNVAGSLVFDPMQGIWVRQKGYRGYYCLEIGAVCPNTPGFWKNQPEAWPVTSLTLGGEVYTQDELLTLLNMPVKKDASLILAHQLIAAKLNIADGSDPDPISSIIADADGLLSEFSGKLPYKVKASSVIGQTMVNLANLLDSYNNGELTPDCIP